MSPLDPAVFVDELLFDWERRHLFDASWVCVARSEELQNCGDQFAESIGETAILYLRAPDGVLRGFVNTCSHQGTQLLPCGEAVNCDVVLCRGHAWTYGLDGQLLSAPAHDETGTYVDKAAHALKQVKTVEWCGMVFSTVDADGSASGFGDVVGDLEELLAPLGTEGFVVAGWREYVVSANWKLVLAHAPSLLGGDPSVPAPVRRTGEAAAVQRGPGSSLSALVFPNLVVRADEDHSVTYLVVPRGVRETVVLCDWAFPPDRGAGAGFDPLPVVEGGDADNVAAWGRAEALHDLLGSGTSGSAEALATPLGSAVESILDERYEALSGK